MAAGAASSAPLPTTRSAAEALSKLRLAAGGFDGAIVDVGLPDQSGEVRVAELRAIFSSMPVVIVSGCAKADLCSQTGDQQSMAFLGKPYTAEQLYASLRSLGIAFTTDKGRTT